MGFKDLDISNIKEKIKKLEDGAKARGQGKSQNEYIKIPPEKSKTYLRFLPSVGNMSAEVPAKLVWTHFNLPSQEMSNIKCFKTYGMDCPMCNMLEKYEAKFEVKSWVASLATNFNVLLLRQLIDQNGNWVERDVGDKTKPRIFQTSGDFNLTWLLKEVDEGGNFLDPVNGNDVCFERVQYKGKFERRVSRKSSPIAATPEQIEAIADAVPDLEEVFRKPDEKYINMMNDATAAVEKAIVERLMPLQNVNHAIPNGYAQPPQQVPQQNPVTGVPVAPPQGMPVAPPPPPVQQAPGVPQQAQPPVPPPVHNPVPPPIPPNPVGVAAPPPPIPQAQPPVAPPPNPAGGGNPYGAQPDLDDIPFMRYDFMNCV